MNALTGLQNASVAMKMIVESFIYKQKGQKFAITLHTVHSAGRKHER